MITNDTIAAVATGNVISAIGIVRVSGPHALTAADNIFAANSAISLKEAPDRQMLYGKAYDAGGSLIDCCLCTLSRAPGSYTGEDTVELHCHGSPVVLQQVLGALFSQGVRQAAAGEFTKRAFLNGKIDLTQAEAVIDLIEAETEIGARNAAGQLTGAVSAAIDDIYRQLTGISAHYHAVVDYPDEDIEEFELTQYMNMLQSSKTKLRQLISTYERGRVLKSGIQAVITGRTNVGKSSLLNTLLGYERAIVTDIHGTTRDTIEEKVIMGGVLLRLTDTAGLRETGEQIERLGVERTKEALERAHLILLVLDGSQPLQEEDYKIIEITAEKAAKMPVVIIINKSDLPAAWDAAQLTSHTKCPQGTLPAVSISAKTGEGIDTLEDEIRRIFPDFADNATGEIITNARQAQALETAAQCLGQAETALTEKVSPDAVLSVIEAAAEALGEVTGKAMREDIISRVFERFCVGK